MSCAVGHRRGSDPKLLWLWGRPAAVALIRPLAWEPPYAVGAALKRQIIIIIIIIFSPLIVIVMNKIETEAEAIYEKEAHGLLVDNDFLLSDSLKSNEHAHHV